MVESVSVALLLLPSVSARPFGGVTVVVLTNVPVAVALMVATIVYVIVLLTGINTVSLMLPPVWSVVTNDAPPVVVGGATDPPVSVAGSMSTTLAGPLATLML